MKQQEPRALLLQWLCHGSKCVCKPPSLRFMAFCGSLSSVHSSTFLLWISFFRKHFFIIIIKKENLFFLFLFGLKLQRVGFKARFTPNYERGDDKKRGAASQFAESLAAVRVGAEHDWHKHFQFGGFTDQMCHIQRLDTKRDTDAGGKQNGRMCARFASPSESIHRGCLAAWHGLSFIYMPLCTYVSALFLIVATPHRSAPLSKHIC